MKKSTIILSVAIALLVIGGLLVWALDRGVIYFQEGSMVPKFSTTAITHPMPSLNRDITYPTGFPDQAREIFDTKLSTLKGELKSNPINQEAWLDLAILYRTIGDQAGAVEIWEYVRSINESDAISRHNLGEYYFHNENDYDKAEAYYRESIAVMPALESNYTDLYEMYRYGVQDNDKAIAALEQGATALSAGPQAYTFYVALGGFYRDLGEKAKARESFTKARDIAVEMNNLGAIRTLDQELARLR